MHPLGLHPPHYRILATSDKSLRRWFCVRDVSGENGSNREENHAAKGTQCSLDLNRIGAVDDGRRTFRMLDVFSVGYASRLRRGETADGRGTDRRSDRIEFEHLDR